jgi:hypothetical protein
MALGQAILDAVSTLASRGGRPVVVFDLDSTLIDTAHRHLAILRAFAEEDGDRALLSVVSELHASDFGYDVHGPLVGRVDLEPARRRALEAFWWARFFDPSWLRHDRPHPGAVSFVEAVSDAGALVVYLSARSARRLGDATVESLHRLGFPLFRGAEIVMLRGEDVSDTAFKLGAFPKLDALGGTVVASFENEPGHLNAFASRYPDGIHVLIDSCHSPGAPPLAAGLPRVADFRSL